jgi:hypothetical protein
MDISMESLSNYHIYLSEILGEALSYDDWSKKQYEEMVKEMDGYEDKVRQQKSRMKKIQVNMKILIHINGVHTAITCLSGILKWLIKNQDVNIVLI